MAKLKPHDIPGIPVEENPEWTDEDFLWSVYAGDFGSFAESHAFLMRREEILRVAESKGLTREMFLPLLPNKPGFEDRVEDAFGEVIKSVRHAAE